MHWKFETVAPEQLATMRLWCSVAVLRHGEDGRRVYPYNHALSTESVKGLNSAMTRLGRSLDGRVTHLGSALAVVKFPNDGARCCFIRWLECRGFTFQHASFMDPEAENTRRMDAAYLLEHPLLKNVKKSPAGDPDWFGLADASYEVADAISGAGDRLGDRVDAAVEKVTDRLDTIDDTLIAHGNHLKDIAEVLEEKDGAYTKPRSQIEGEAKARMASMIPRAAGGGETAYVESKVEPGWMPRMRPAKPITVDIKVRGVEEFKAATERAGAAMWEAAEEKSLTGVMEAGYAQHGSSKPSQVLSQNDIRTIYRMSTAMALGRPAINQVISDVMFYGSWHTYIEVMRAKSKQNYLDVPPAVAWQDGQDEAAAAMGAEHVMTWPIGTGKVIVAGTYTDGNMGYNTGPQKWHTNLWAEICARTSGVEKAIAAEAAKAVAELKEKAQREKDTDT